MKPKILAVVGPTASGKSELAVKLALELDGEIVNADSRQIYKGLDLLTSKPDSKEFQAVPHHLYSFLSPVSEFSVAEYQRLAHKAIEGILKRRKLPILVGGTGLYVDSVTGGLVFAGKPDRELREQLNNMGTTELLTILEQVAPETKVDVRNRVRIIRAIEIAKSGIKPSKTEPPYDTLKLGVLLTPETLSKKIESRIRTMSAKELAAEVEGYPLDTLPSSALGVAELLAYMQGRITAEMLKDQLISLHKNYAKRQMTWFKKDPDIVWVGNLKEAKKAAEKFLG